MWNIIHPFTEIDMDVGEEEGASGLAKLTAEKKDRYDEIYFDSDEEDAGGTKGRGEYALTLGIWGGGGTIRPNILLVL